MFSDDDRVRLICRGILKGCEECQNIEFRNGFCSHCRRPLDRKIGETCNSIIAYKPKDLEKRGKIDVICRVCNSVTTF